MFKVFNRIRAIRKRWFAVAGATMALLAIGLVIGGGLTAGRIMADSDSFGYGFGHDYDERRGGHHRGGDADGANHDALLSRVAEIVGVEAATLQAAFVTAHEEQVTAKFGERAAGLVAAGTLTQEQADAANAWFAARPAGSGRLAYYAAGSTDAARVSEKLSRMVAAGYITQEESDALVAWHGQRPEGLPAFGKVRGEHHGGGRDGDGDGG